MNVPPFKTSPGRGARSYTPPDLCSEEGAKRAAREIVHIWRCHGYQTVKAWVEPLLPEDYRHNSGKNGGKAWAIKTNLVGGLPPK